MVKTKQETIIIDLPTPSNSRTSDSDILEPHRKLLLRDTFNLSSKFLGIRDGSYLFSSDANTLDVYDMAIQRLDLTDKVANLKEEYIIKVRYLSTFFSFTYLHTLPLDTVRALNDALVEVQEAMNSGRLSADDITDDTRALARVVLDAPNLKDGSRMPNERWSEFDDRISGETAINFLIRVWGGDIRNGRINRNDLSEVDPSLSSAIRQFYSRRVRNSKNKAGALEDLPEFIQIWFEQKAIRSKSQVTQDLLKYNIKKPEDAFQRDLPAREAQRLYNACKRRIASKST